MKSPLPFIILHTLNKKPLSGYLLIKEIQTTTKCWKPSTGSIYPLLIGMEQEGLLNSKNQKRSTIYSLTEKGKQELRKLIPDKEKMITTFLHHFQIASSMLSKKDAESMREELLKRIKDMV